MNFYNKRREKSDEEKIVRTWIRWEKFTNFFTLLVKIGSVLLVTMGKIRQASKES
jgi:hypothetical protein